MKEKTQGGIQTAFTHFYKDIKTNFYSYIIVAIVSGIGSVLAFVGATGGAILALPERVEAIETNLSEMQALHESIDKFNSQQVIINEKQIVINENIEKDIDSIDQKLDILIKR